VGREVLPATDGLRYWGSDCWVLFKAESALDKFSGEDDFLCVLEFSAVRSVGPDLRLGHVGPDGGLRQVDVL
jgi:hypothetical protein